MEHPVAVKDDSQAFALLSQWLAGKKIPTAEFVGWPVLSIKVTGDDYDASINSGQMHALTDLRLTVGRAYSVLAHGAYDYRRLKDEEEEELEFKTKLRSGSSITETDFSPLVQAFSTAVHDHPTFSVVGAVLLGLSIVARPMIMKYFENRRASLDAKAQQNLFNFALSATELKQQDLYEKSLEKLAKTHPQIYRAVADVQGSYWRFASSSIDADKVEVAGITLEHDQIELLSERRQRRPRSVQEIQGIFTVAGVRKDSSRYQIALESTDLSISAVFRKPHLTDTKIRQLLKIFQAGGKIAATIELRSIDGAKPTGRLLRFKAVD
jgi:hypothetical protein